MWIQKKYPKFAKFWIFEFWMKILYEQIAFELSVISDYLLCSANNEKFWTFLVINEQIG